MKQCKARLPPKLLEDDDYFKQLAAVFLSPKELPVEMTEVLYAVLEMANDKGVDRLRKHDMKAGQELIGSTVPRQLLEGSRTHLGPSTKCMLAEAARN